MSKFVIFFGLLTILASAAWAQDPLCGTGTVIEYSCSDKARTVTFRKNMDTGWLTLDGEPACVLDGVNFTVLEGRTLAEKPVDKWVACAGKAEMVRTRRTIWATVSFTGISHCAVSSNRTPVAEVAVPMQCDETKFTTTLIN